MPPDKQSLEFLNLIAAFGALGVRVQSIKGSDIVLTVPDHPVLRPEVVAHALEPYKAELLKLGWRVRL